jgi:1-acyl-sn-glycerol-3-phosphate acyltransferase
MMDRLNHPLYLSIRFLLKSLARVVLWVRGYRIVNNENLPQKRMACILVSNHAAFVDSVYFIASLKPRFAICGAKPKYFRKWPVRQVFQIANILKVDSRDQFLRDCGTLVRSEEIILIYPEMGRNADKMGPFQTWAAEVALEENLNVLPCYLYGTTKGQAGKKRLIVGSFIQSVGDAESLTETYRRAIETLKRKGQDNP